MGATRPPTVTDDDLSPGEGTGCDVGSRTHGKDRRSRGRGGTLLLSEPGIRFWRNRGACAQRGSEPRPTLGSHRGVDGRGSLPHWRDDGGVHSWIAGARSETLAGGISDQALSRE